LGHYYHDVLHDDNKSRRCYQKALDLSPFNPEVGAALSDVCLALGDDNAALAVYHQVTREVPIGKAKWAWLRLGLYQMSRNESSQATASFQNVVKADPEDRCGWECLGDAYLQRGGYVAALKAFTRAAQV
jgi:superkiller protein 3